YLPSWRAPCYLHSHVSHATDPARAGPAGVAAAGLVHLRNVVGRPVARPAADFARRAAADDLGTAEPAGHDESGKRDGRHDWDGVAGYRRLRSEERRVGKEWGARGEAAASAWGRA